ncbi:MAG TPA: hypothetical protein VFT55_12175 [Planctomycetota bacterium]|nr:hypothetical protein [Planctomycetota bacterium]
MTVPIALLLIATTGVVHCWRHLSVWDPARVGNDEATATRKRLAPLRAELAARDVAFVSLVTPEVSLDQLEGAPQAVLDAVSTALHRQLTTGVCEPPPGFDAAAMNSLVTFFRATFPSEQNADPAAVRTNMRDWWVRLVLGMHQTGIEYGLAPILVRAGAPCLVGVFEPGVDHQALAQRRGLTVVRELGDGIVLFREGR